jgi:hypothetical protein
MRWEFLRFFFKINIIIFTFFKPERHAIALRKKCSPGCTITQLLQFTNCLRILRNYFYILFHWDTLLCYLKQFCIVITLLVLTCGTLTNGKMSKKIVPKLLSQSNNYYSTWFYFCPNDSTVWQSFICVILIVSTVWQSFIFVILIVSTVWQSFILVI